jgi:glycosyltransferase involved in cell wall biosynthesis
VLFASGNGDPVKRPWLASAAVAKINREGRKVELHFLSGVQNSEVPAWLNAGDVLLLTSLHEGSPTVVKEALACGLPVVSVDVGDVAERIGHIKGCYLAPAESEILAEKLCLVRLDGKRIDCGAQITELSSLHAAHKLAEYYAELLRRYNPQRAAEPTRRISLSLTPIDEGGRGFESWEARGRLPNESAGRRAPTATQPATNPE